MKHFLGISAGFHDAAVTVVNSTGGIEFAAHSERYSGRKNDPSLDPMLINELRQWHFDEIAFYERPWMHNLQQIVSGQHQFGAWTGRGAVKQHLMGSTSVRGQAAAPVRTFSHHLSHAAAGFQTSPFDSAAVVVIDAIGEMDTISIYRAWYDHAGRAQYVRCWRQGYPHSIGLFYSAMTERVGLRPMDEEYITMGMSAYGNNKRAPEMMMTFWQDWYRARARHNLHAGVGELWADSTPENIAACAQTVVERIIRHVMLQAQQITGESNLVYMGGVALNCLANRGLGDYFDRIWIMPNPGDAGSSLGAAALAYGGKLEWQDAFLGHNITGDYPVQDVVNQLMTSGIAGVASGRAEFGPRALGNRSLLADPRGSDIKDRVNDIKQRQRFRPFAPVILEEHVSRYFEMPRNVTSSPYMQFVMRCRRPDLFPAICHVDRTSRVQTVPPGRSGIRRLLEAWYTQTGCPMLLNTSLNVRGEPMVNDRAGADRFEQLYGVTVFS
jgi:carbamoyltransferase